MVKQVAGTKISDPSEGRRAVRELVDFGTQFSLRGKMQDLRVINISSLGLMGRVSADIRQGDRVIIQLPQVRTVEAIVRWVEDGRVGTEFAASISAADYALMLVFMPKRQTVW
jgi:hypothetical protein